MRPAFLDVALNSTDLAEAAKRETATYLGPGAEAYRGMHWLAGAGGFFTLPDSGLRVRQTRYTCPSLPKRAVREVPERMEIAARVTRNGRVTDVRLLGGRHTAAFLFLRREMERRWRFQVLKVDDRVTPYRLRFITRISVGQPGDRYHCAWGGPGTRGRRGSLTPTWVLYVPRQGLPVAVAYIAVLRQGERAGGLVPVHD